MGNCTCAELGSSGCCSLGSVAAGLLPRCMSPASARSGPAAGAADVGDGCSPEALRRLQRRVCKWSAITTPVLAIPTSQGGRAAVVACGWVCGGSSPCWLRRGVQQPLRSHRRRLAVRNFSKLRWSNLTPTPTPDPNKKLYNCTDGHKKKSKGAQHHQTWATRSA